MDHFYRQRESHESAFSNISSFKRKNNKLKFNQNASPNKIVVVQEESDFKRLKPVMLLKAQNIKVNNNTKD